MNRNPVNGISARLDGTFTSVNGKP